MMKDANGILKKQTAGESCKMSKFSLVLPTLVMNVSNSHGYTAQSTMWSLTEERVAKQTE